MRKGLTHWLRTKLAGAPSSDPSPTPPVTLPAVGEEELRTVPMAGGPEAAPSFDDDDTLSLLARQPGALERYTDNGEVGRGGMGRVHSVLDKSLLREVALKVLRPELERQKRQVQRFIREAQLTSQLDHPNIVPIHELGRDVETGYYISMRLVKGKTLTEAVEQAGAQRLAPDRLVEFLEIFIKVCEAVSFAHSRGVIHRDLKPSNLMVGAFGQVYVMDWGVARLMPEHSSGPTRYVMVSGELDVSLDEEPGNIIGTPRYMPPEQIQGLHEQVDERSDVFALGATLYHVLTGRPPYTASSYYNTLLEALAGKVRPPEEVVGGDRVPPGLARIAMKAMAFKPDERYDSVVALQKDVERFLRGSWDQEIQRFPAGGRIVTEGEEGDVAYIILEGRCSVFTMAGDKKVVLRELVPGEVFAETAVFSAAVRTASVEAIDDVTVKVVSRETLTHGLGLSSWMGTFVKALAERFRDVDERLRRIELAAAISEKET
jgi:serine/threonine-protein kinase